MSKGQIRLGGGLVTKSCQALAASQAPWAMEFSRQEYWSVLPFPSPRFASHHTKNSK